MDVGYRSLETTEELLAREKAELTDSIQKDAVSFGAVSSALVYAEMVHGPCHPLVWEFSQDLLELEDDINRNQHRIGST